MTYVDGFVLDLTERMCRRIQLLTGRTNVWLAVQLTNLSIVVYFVWAGASILNSDWPIRIAIGVFCAGLLYILSQTVLKVPVETSEQSAYQRVAKGYRNPRRVRDAMLRLLFLALAVMMAGPVALVYFSLHLPLVLLGYSLVVLTTALLYVLACDPLPPCGGLVTDLMRRLKEVRRRRPAVGATTPKPFEPSRGIVELRNGPLRTFPRQRPRRNTMSQKELLALPERLQLWGKTLLSLSEPDRSRRLVDALNNGDRAGLTELVGDRLFEQGTCIDVVDTLSRLVNFGPRRSEERCEVINRLREPNPSKVNYRVYRLSDGRLVAVTEAEWWAYYDRAAQDLTWQAQNRDFLRALGIISCVMVEVSGEQLVTIDRSRTICFPRVTRPWD